jgi:hypothetical protein
VGTEWFARIGEEVRTSVWRYESNLAMYCGPRKALDRVDALNAFFPYYIQ